jgi:NADH-quinone oxidoreductase subunit M
MNCAVLGIFSFNLQGLEGSLLLMLSHGLVSGALFILIGFIYDRYHIKIIKYYSSLTQTMPIYSIFFCFFSFCNVGFPGTFSFLGEFLIFISINKISLSLFFFLVIGVFLTGCYSI